MVRLGPSGLELMVYGVVWLGLELQPASIPLFHISSNCQDTRSSEYNWNRVVQSEYNSYVTVVLELCTDPEGRVYGVQ